MIILRQKIFRRDIFTEDMKLLPPNRNYQIIYKIEKSKSYDKDFKKPGTDKDTIKKLIKDIKSGYIYSDGIYNCDTHYLSDYSKVSKTLVFSKCINEFDRLNYRIYPPTELFEKLDKNTGKLITVYEQKIVLECCRGHNLNGQGDYLKNNKTRKKENPSSKF